MSAIVPVAAAAAETTNVGNPWVNILIFALFVGVTLVVVIVVIDVFNRAGGWPALTRWKAVWPLVEGVMWGGFVLAWPFAGTPPPARVDGVAVQWRGRELRFPATGRAIRIEVAR